MKACKRMLAFILVLSLVFTGVIMDAFTVRADVETGAILANVSMGRKDPVKAIGGKRAFKLEGTNLKFNSTKAKVTLKDSTEDITEISDTLSPVRVDLDRETLYSHINVSLSFPANDSTQDKVYVVSFSVDGGKTFNDKKSESHESGLSAVPIEVTVSGKKSEKPNPEKPNPGIDPVPAKNPVVSGITVTGQYGELVALSIKGKDLTGAKFKEKVTNEDGTAVEGYSPAKWGKIYDSGFSQNIVLPINNTENDITYKIYISIDGGKTFLEDKAVAVKVPGKAPESNAEVISIKKATRELGNEGASITITINTNEKTTKDKIKTRVTKIYDGVEEIVTGIVVGVDKLKDDGKSFNISASFPKNDRKNAVEYRIEFNAKGSEIEFQSTPVFKATVEGTGIEEEKAMVVYSIKASTPALPKTGGMSNITVRGENIDVDKLVPAITKIVEGVSTPVELKFDKMGGGKSAVFMITFPETLSDKADTYNITIGGKTAIVTVGGRVAGALLDILPSKVYTNKGKTIITVYFDEDIFAVSDDYKELKNGITLIENRDGTETKRKLSENDLVAIDGNRIIITLEAPFDGEINSKIEIGERLLKNSKGNEARKFSYFVEIAKTIINSAEFIKGEVLTNKGGDLEVRLVGEGFMKEVLGMKAPVNTLVKVLENNKSKTELYGITTKLGKKVNDDKIKITTNEEGTEQTIRFTLPANDSGKTKTYSVMVSLDGGLTYSSALGVNILENRAKRLVASVLPTGENDGKPSLSFMSITSYGTQGGGKEEADITHTETPNGQESKKTWVTAFGANLDKSLTKIRIIDRNGIIWYPLQNEGTSDSTSNFIMVSSDGTGIFGNGNTQMLEVIGMNNILTTETFTYQLAVDGKNYDTETVVTVTVPYDGGAKNTKKEMTEDFIRNVKVSHVTDTGKVLEAETEVRGYSWSKLRSFGIKDKEFPNCKVIGYRRNGSEEITPITGLYEDLVGKTESVEFVYDEAIPPVETQEVVPSHSPFDIIPGVNTSPSKNTEIKDIAGDNTPLDDGKGAPSTDKKSWFVTRKNILRITKEALHTLGTKVKSIRLSVKDGSVSLRVKELKDVTDGTSYLKIIKKNNVKAVKKVLKNKKYASFKAAYGSRLYDVKLVVKGKNITKTTSKLTVSLKTGKTKKGSIYVLNLKTGKKIKAKYDKKTKSVVFSTKELGKFVVTLKK